MRNDLSETSHTPGPWMNQGIYIMARNPNAPLPNAQTIGRAFPDHATVGGDTLANAVLMAAAPELLAMLENTLDCLIMAGGMERPGMLGQRINETAQLAAQAIARAKGII